MGFLVTMVRIYAATCLASIKRAEQQALQTWILPKNDINSLLGNSVDRRLYVTRQRYWNLDSKVSHS